MSEPTTAKVSALVKEAYKGRLARIRVGLTPKDLQDLRAAVKRGELAYVRDPNKPGNWMYWQPVMQEAT